MLCRKCYRIWVIRKDDHAWEKLCLRCQVWMAKQTQRMFPSVSAIDLITRRK